MHRVRHPRIHAFAILSVLCALPALGLAQSPLPASGSGASDVACRMTAFRVRSDFESVLNAEEGWAGAPNGNVTLDAERPFRLRVEVETMDPGEQTRRFWLQYRRNEGAWTDLPAADFPYPLGVTPPISVVSNGEYAPGEATEDLLAGTDAPFRPGAGIVLQATTPSWQGGQVHGEWEWPLVIRRFADGAATNEAGEVFELRVAGTAGACASVASPRLTLAVPPGLLGGTFVETPGPIGPWQAANGDLYFTMEPAETTNVLMMVKSSDGGRTWREVDGARRPVTDDLEGFATAFDGDTVHMLHQTSEDVWHHAFRTSDHPTHPDTWAIRDERLASPEEPPVQVAALAARSDGSLVGVYGGPERIHLRTRGADGRWGDETTVDADSGPRLSGPMAVTGRDDVVHLAYTGQDGTAWYRTLGADGVLGTRQRVSDQLARGSVDVGSVLPLVYLPEDDTLVVIYRTADGRLRERRASAGAPLGAERVVTDRVVVQNAVDADQAGADAIALGGDAHVLFIDAESGSLFHTSTGTDGNWREAVVQQEDVDAQWVRGRAVQRKDGQTVYGYVFDAGSNGGSGMNRYGEVPPAAR